VGLVASRGGWGLTNCESYDTLALLTRTGDLYETLNTRTGDLYETLNTRTGDLYETLNTSPGGVYKVLNTPDTECFPQYNT